MAQNVTTALGKSTRLGVPSLIQMGALNRRRSAFQLSSSLFLAPLPSDAIGTCVLTLTNVVIGSRINIRDQLGTITFYDDLAAASTVVISLDVYSAGSALNNWRVKVRKASSSPYYQPYETLMTASVGSTSIYVYQITDE